MTDAEIDARFERLHLDFRAVVSGLSLMNETLATHSDLLAQILTAATETAPPSDLSQALKRIAEILAGQEAVLERLDERLADLPNELATVLAENAPS